MAVYAYFPDFQSKKIAISRGDDIWLDVEVRQDGAPYNCQDAELTLTARRTADGPAQFVAQTASGLGSWIDRENGKARLIIQGSDTATLPSSVTVLVYDLQMVTTVTSTLAEGTVIVGPDVTT